jgi:hypothetical protein
LTRLGYFVDTPRVDADGSIWFSASDAHRFPGLYPCRLEPRRPVRVTSCYGGSSLSLGRDVVIFDQLEVTRGAGLTSDLYASIAAPAARDAHARARVLVDPDLSPERHAAGRDSNGARRFASCSCSTPPRCFG